MPRLLLQNQMLASVANLGRQIEQLVIKQKAPSIPAHNTTLNYDILSMVLDYIYQASPKSIYALSLTSKALHRLAQGYLFRKLRFTFSRCWNHRNNVLLQRLQDDAQARSYVQEIYVNWTAGANPRHDTIEGLHLVSLFIELIPQFTKLKRFIWDAQCPILRRVLYRDDRPLFHDASCELYTICPYRSDIDSSFRLVQDYTQLVALDVNIGRSQIIAMNQLRRVLASCKNLQKLAVTCVPDSTHGRQWLLEPASQLPRLTYLQVRGLHLVQYAFEGWEGCVQWESLEHFEISDAISTRSSNLSLSNLSSLTLWRKNPPQSISSSRETISNFICGIPRLQHLNLVGLPFSLLEDGRLLEVKGKSLKTLTLHDDESGSDTIHHTPSIDFIRRLGELCPGLETCGLDIAIDEQEWPWKTLTTIASSLRSIKHLSLNLSFTPSPHQITNPSSSLTTINLSIVHHIWTFLWSTIHQAPTLDNNPTLKPRLLTLKITSKTHLSFEARLCERDDLAAEGHAEVVCLELEGLYEKYGYGKLENEDQERYRRDMMAQAEDGTSTAKMQRFGAAADNWQARPLETTLMRMAEW